MPRWKGSERWDAVGVRISLSIVHYRIACGCPIYHVAYGNIGSARLWWWNSAKATRALFGRSQYNWVPMLCVAQPSSAGSGVLGIIRITTPVGRRDRGCKIPRNGIYEMELGSRITTDIDVDARVLGTNTWVPIAAIKTVAD